MATYEIRLEDFEIKMYLGIHDFERENMQRVLVSITVTVSEVDYKAGEFWDYDWVVKFLRGFNGTRIDTQEELVERVHGFLMELGCDSAEVYSRKPDVFPDCGSVGLIFRG